MHRAVQPSCAVKNGRHRPSGRVARDHNESDLQKKKLKKGKREGGNEKNEDDEDPKNINGSVRSTVCTLYLHHSKLQAQESSRAC